jgi:hypothetical protein
MLTLPNIKLHARLDLYDHSPSFSNLACTRDKPEWTYDICTRPCLMRSYALNPESIGRTERIERQDLRNAGNGTGSECRIERER